MPFSPKALRELAHDKVHRALHLQDSIDVTMFQHFGSGTAMVITLARGNHDQAILEAVLEPYRALGWNVSLSDQGGALRITMTAPVPQEKT